jgi:hypothetical protein
MRIRPERSKPLVTAVQDSPVDYVNVFTGTSNSPWMLRPQILNKLIHMQYVGVYFYIEQKANKIYSE